MFVLLTIWMSRVPIQKLFFSSVFFSDNQWLIKNPGKKVFRVDLPEWVLYYCALYNSDEVLNKTEGSIKWQKDKHERKLIRQN